MFEWAYQIGSEIKLCGRKTSTTSVYSGGHM